MPNHSFFHILQINLEIFRLIYLFSSLIILIFKKSDYYIGPYTFCTNRNCIKLNYNSIKITVIINVKLIWIPCAIINNCFWSFSGFLYYSHELFSGNTDRQNHLFCLTNPRIYCLIFAEGDVRSLNGVIKLITVCHHLFFVSGDKTLLFSRKNRPMKRDVIFYLWFRVCLF